MVQFLAGANAGAISRTLTAPLERIKIILQAKDFTERSNLSKEFQNIKEKEGLKGFFKGNGANVTKVIPESALRFMFFDYARMLIASESGKTTIIQKFLAGVISGIMSHTIVYPLEVIKTRLSLAQEGVYNGIFNCFLRIVQTEGLYSLYKGWRVSCMGMVPNMAIDLSLFYTFRDWYATSFESRPSIPTLLAFGSFSSLCGQLVAYPFNLMRTKLQSQGLPGKPILYNGLWDCASKIYKNEGFMGFYRGGIANFSRNIPAVAISYAVYEKIRFILSKF
jgi:solute carrier family 25 phosphate transporter 23/24/25/41